MARVRRGGSEEEADVNVTPLLDIVFIMLIFFIVTATFVREKGIDLTPPPPPDDEPKKHFESLVLSVQPDGFVQVNRGRIIDPRSAKPVVEEFLAREPQGSVLVSAHPDAENGVVVTVLDRAESAGANPVLTLQSRAAE